MSTKKWTLSLLLLLLFSIFAFALMMYITDPLLQYGTENTMFSYYEYNEMYSNPGIAKNYTYDTVLVGTSMIRNTDVDECDALFDCNMVRLSYSGGTTYNMKSILDVCFGSENDIKRVFWELDQFQILGSSDAPRYPLPEYLYNESYADDSSYLLNLDIFYHHTVNNLLGTLQGRSSPAERRSYTLSGDFSKSGMLANYSRPAQSGTITEFKTLQPKVDANLSKNIIPLLEANPDTTFTFFLPPFSVLYWDAELRKGSFDAVMDATEYAMQCLLKYENVEVYFYQNDWETITNLDNYKDFSHYGPWINSYIMESLTSGAGRITTKNCKSSIDEMKDFIHNYNFDIIFSEQ